MLLKNRLSEIKSLLNNGNVLTSKEERYCYATDASNINTDFVEPDVVVFVETIEDVQRVLKYAYQHEIPVISRGAGTNMVGACVSNKGGIILNFSKMNSILDINTVNMTARVHPGVILGDLKTIVEEKGLFFPPDPSNYKVSTIGGAIAQSSGGAMAFKYGTTKDYVLSLTVVTANGEVLKLGADTIKDASGYHLAQLMVGSEGTLAVIVEAVLKLIPKPKTQKTVIAYFEDIDKTVDAVSEIILNNISPSTIDFMDRNSMLTVEQYTKVGIKTENNYLLMVQLDGDECTVKGQCNNVLDLMSKFAVDTVVLDNVNEEKFWNARRSSFAATTRLAPDVISDDIIVPRERIAEMVKYCEEIIRENELMMCMVGHIGDGNLHPQIALNLDNESDFRKYNSAKSAIYKKVFEIGGRISAEHGIGLAKLPYLGNTIDKKTLEYMKMIKKVFDPKNILNPDKIFEL